MSKLNIFKTFCAVFSAICALSFALPVPAIAEPVSAAGQIPAGYGYTHGRIPVIHTSGASKVHDQNLMRYDKNSKLSKDSFSEYKKYGYGVPQDNANQQEEQDQ